MSRSFEPQPILDVARELGVPEELVQVYGRGKAKIDLAAIDRPPSGAGRLILVSAINPTPAGEGKTTTSVGLAMGLRRLGKRIVFDLEGDLFLVLHLMIAGRLHWKKRGAKPPGKIGLAPDMRAASFSDSTRSCREHCSAGARPKRIPVSTEIPAENPST